ncbi:Uncharacterised protein [Mycoplasmopsis arginini]|nr:Uncharacterised protein [Chlamydia trachomatis]SGA24498.1 Uncharacterised protein [Mycoplasmopsis arginini]SGA26939.1 Uncharacterised protein [Mycoplasmopsis arginini]
MFLSFIKKEIRLPANPNAAKEIFKTKDDFDASNLISLKN